MASSSSRDIERELRQAIEVDGEKELNKGLNAFAAEVKAYAEAISPFDPADTGPHYKDSWKIGRRNIRGRLSSRRLSNSSPLVNIVEDGSYHRPQGGDSPPHNIFARVAFHYRGSVDGRGDDAEELLP